MNDDLPTQPNPMPCESFGTEDNSPSIEKNQETKKDVATYQSPPGQHLLHWATFWISTWAGTAFAGGLFGAGLGLFAIAENPVAPFYALFFGLVWAGGTGLLVFLHVGVICWTFWWLGRPIIVATLTGGLVGAICGMFLFSLITAPMGAAGAYLAGLQFLKSESGKEFQATIESAKTVGRLRFTTKDLFLRMTVISIMIAGWTAWIKSISHL